MKFRFYITNLHVGAIEGTNDESVAQRMAGSEDCFVVDSETGEQLMPDGRQPIAQVF